jgi:surfeit locus 1 family protein
MPPVTQGLSLLRQNIDMKSFSDETGLRLMANALQTGEPSEGLLRDWPTSLSGSDKNRAYALQWFALACVCIGLFAWFQIIQKIKHD